MAAAAWLSDGKAPLEAPIAEGYHGLQEYSAHGSGLEYGYGSPSANAITMAYREGYVQSALLATEAALQRATRRLVQPLESFETQGVFVFNGLGAPRDAPVTVEFPREAPQRYRVIDPETERELPSHHEGYTLRFVVPDLPALGYRRLRLEPRGEGQVETSLALGASTIENAAFRLRLDPETGAVASLVQKGTGRELIRQGAALPFGVPARSVFGDPGGLVPLAEGAVRITAHDERPVRVRLEVERPGDVVSRVTYALWEGMDRVEVEASVDLEALAPVTATETYGLPFPLALDDPTTHLGLLGGFADPSRDLFEGVLRDAHALRQSLALSDARGTVSWAAADSRVVRLYAPEGEPSPTVVAVLANHFPEAWNRNEENVGVWPLRFALTYREGAFDPAFSDLFGRDLAQPPLAYPTWLTAGETARSFLDLDGDLVHLMAFQATGDGLLVRLRSPDGERSARVRLSIPGRPLEAADRVTFLGSAPQPLPVEDGGVSVTLGAHAITTLRLRLTGARAAGALSHSAPSTP
jgi:hypothetical protein